jgi:hypothetical protein
LNLALVSRRSSMTGMKLGSRKGMCFLMISTRSWRVLYLSADRGTWAGCRKARPGPPASSCKTIRDLDRGKLGEEWSRGAPCQGSLCSPPRRRAAWCGCGGGLGFRSRRGLGRGSLGRCPKSGRTAILC